MLDQGFDRKRALNAMATCETSVLKAHYDALGTLPAVMPVRGPEIGMVMLRGRAGGGGAPFNLGEATVTRATIKLADGEIGHAVVLGRETGKARMIAHLDALAQRAHWAERIEHGVIAPVLAANEDAMRQRAEETESTRVDFFTVARGED